MTATIAENLGVQQEVGRRSTGPADGSRRGRHSPPQLILFASRCSTPQRFMMTKIRSIPRFHSICAPTPPPLIVRKAGDDHLARGHVTHADDPASPLSADDETAFSTPGRDRNRLRLLQDAGRNRLVRRAHHLVENWSSPPLLLVTSSFPGASAQRGVRSDGGRRKTTIRRTAFFRFMNSTLRLNLPGLARSGPCSIRRTEDLKQARVLDVTASWYLRCANQGNSARGVPPQTVHVFTN